MRKNNKNNSHSTIIYLWIPVIPQHGYAVCRGVLKSTTVPIPAKPVTSNPRVFLYLWQSLKGWGFRISSQLPDTPFSQCSQCTTPYCTLWDEICIMIANSEDITNFDLFAVPDDLAQHNLIAPILDLTLLNSESESPLSMPSSTLSSQSPYTITPTPPPPPTMATPTIIPMPVRGSDQHG